MLSTCFHDSEILKLLKLLMSMAFGQNGLDFALKIEKPISSQAVYVGGNSHTHKLCIYYQPPCNLCGLLRATLLRTEVIMDFEISTL